MKCVKFGNINIFLINENLRLNYGVRLEMNLSKCNISQLQDIMNILIEEGLVVLKHQKISVERFNEINEVWGIHQPANIWANHKKFPIIIRVTNKEVQKGKKGLAPGKILGWHSDGCFSPDPEEFVCLWCIDPGKVGATSFACGRHAYNSLDDFVKEEIEQASLFITNEVSKTYMKKGPYDPLLSYEQKDLDKHSSRTRYYAGGADNNPYDKNISYIQTTNPNNAHKKRKKTVRRPLVAKHPYSEKKGLYFFQIYGVAEINGLKTLPSKDIFDILVQNYVGPSGKFYLHKWEMGDGRFDTF